MVVVLGVSEYPLLLVHCSGAGQRPVLPVLPVLPVGLVMGRLVWACFSGGEGD